MNQLVTEAIILNRTDFGEADRILQVLTPDYGKLSLLARGVRRVKSKLAGGIELFSVSEITFIKGRGEINTLISTRLKKHYGHIVKDLDRSMFGYNLIKRLNRVTEDQTEAEYFELLRDAFEALDDTALRLDLVELWFATQLIRLSGQAPNLYTDEAGNKLVLDHNFDFSFEHMTFVPSMHSGSFNPDDIKFLRLAIAGNSAKVLARVKDNPVLVKTTFPLVNTMLTTLLRV